MRTFVLLAAVMVACAALAAPVAPGYHPPGGIVDPPAANAGVGGPMEMVAFRSAMVVVISAGETGKATEMELQIPEYPTKKTKGYFAKVTLGIHDTYRSAADEKKAPKSIEVLVRRPEPTKDPKEPAPTDFIACSAGRPAPCIMLKKDSHYIVFVSKLPSGEYYLPMFQDSAVPANNKDVMEQAKKAANVNDWPWGKASEGIQLVMIPASKEFERFEGGPGQQSNVGIQLMLAVRNTSKKTLFINHYAPDRFLGVTADDGKGKKIQGDPLDWTTRADMKAFEADKDLTELKPGAVMMLLAHESSNLVIAPMDLPLGKWKLTVSYTSKRTVPQKRVWVGTAVSATAEIEVIKMPMRPM